MNKIKETKGFFYVQKKNRDKKESKKTTCYMILVSNCCGVYLSRTYKKLNLT